MKNSKQTNKNREVSPNRRKEKYKLKLKFKHDMNCIIMLISKFVTYLNDFYALPRERRYSEKYKKN